MQALQDSAGNEKGAETGGILALLDATLKHERRFWRRWLESNGLQNARDRHLGAVGDAVAAITLRGRLENRKAVLDLLAALTGDDPHGPEVDSRTLADLVADMYRGTDASYAQSLQPDILGEHLVMRVLERKGVSSGEWIDRVLEDDDEDAMRNAFTVLGRLGARLNAEETSPDSKASVERWIAELLRGDVEGRAVSAFEAALALGEETAFASLADFLAMELDVAGKQITAAVARPILAELDRGGSTPVSMRRLAVLCGSALARSLKQQSPADREDLARVLNNLGAMLSDLGRREDALDATREAVDHYRELARSRPDAFLPNLAGSLNNLGLRLSALGRREDALDATREAVEHYRDLAESRPDVFQALLAQCLYARGLILQKAERAREASAAFEEGLSLLLPLAERLPDAFRALTLALARGFIKASDDPEPDLLDRVREIYGDDWNESGNGTDDD